MLITDDRVAELMARLRAKGKLGPENRMALQTAERLLVTDGALRRLVEDIADAGLIPESGKLLGEYLAEEEQDLRTEGKIR